MSDIEWPDDAEDAAENIISDGIYSERPAVCIADDVISALTPMVKAIVADVWERAYVAGVSDEQTSQDWTNGQIPPARINPYRD